MDSRVADALVYGVRAASRCVSGYFFMAPMGQVTPVPPAPQ